MVDRATIESLDRDGLIDLVLKLVEQNAELRRELDELKRRGKRQASPFSKDQRKSDPKPPGRKPGQGPFTYRTAPDAATFSQPPVDVSVTEETCPKCNGGLLADGHELVTRTDIAPAPKPEIRAWHIQMCRCADCGHRVRGRHPEVPADQYGATAHRLCDRLMATAQWMHYGLGLPVRKLPAVFSELYGIELTQSALTQDALKRAAGQLDGAYEQLRTEIATRDHIHSDDTGWRIAGSSAWLMGFTSDHETLYQIRRHHGNREVRQVIDETYGGVMHTDRFTSYDAKELSAVAQQKCLAHVQRNLRELIDQQHGSARRVPQSLKQLFAEAIELWQHRTEMKDYRQRADRIQAEVDWLLWPRRLSNTANDRMVRELGWHNARGNLLRFLHDPERAEPTNNEAERALRPAVIARKVSHCSKTEGGADTHAKFASVIATTIKRGATSVVEALLGIFSTGRVPASYAN